MLYALHETAYRTAAPLSAAAHMARDFWRSPLNMAGNTGLGRNLYASADLLANLTRLDGEEFLRLAPAIPVHSDITRYPLEHANQALDDLRHGRFDGAAVLAP